MTENKPYDEKFIRNYERRNKIVAVTTVVGLTGLGGLVGGALNDSHIVTALSGVVMTACFIPTILLQTDACEDYKYFKEKDRQLNYCENRLGVKQQK